VGKGLEYKMFNIKNKLFTHNRSSGDDLGCLFVIESPKRPIISDKKLVISGWIIPNRDKKVLSLRSKNNNIYHDIQYGIERNDVAKSKGNLNKKCSLFSGFYSEQEYVDGEFSIELNMGDGYRTIYKTNVRYSPELLFDSVYNKDLAANLAEHQILLENKKTYYFEDEYDKSYIRGEQDPRLIAFYLPQFHPIKQNDIAWGKGFTEWTNVTSGQPRFIGHQQPILPSGLGFYDLRIEDNIFRQIELAKKYGVYGFCFYYYWFSGEKILDKPLDSFLSHKDWDFNFMICWANENWTRRWDGRDKDVIIAQKYLEDDPVKFIKDVEHILLDRRYIRHNNKPVLIIYRGSELKAPDRYIECWRDYFKKKHNQDLEILSMMNFDASDPRQYGFDAGVEFSPLTDYRMSSFNKVKSRVYNLNSRMIDLNFTGAVVDYRSLIEKRGSDVGFDFPTYRCLSPSWDNEARKKGKGSLTLYGANPDLYTTWLDSIVKDEVSKKKSPMIFVNAWNEWAEGAILEPTAHNGYSVLNRTVETLARYSANKTNIKNFKMFRIDKQDNHKLAIVVHVYYEDCWDYIQNKLSCLDTKSYDLFVTYTKISENWIDKIKKCYPNVNLKLVPNRGRDILPFLFTINRLEQLGYNKILKIHTKKSKHRDDGNVWFEELIDSLLPGKSVINKIISTLDTNQPVVIGPKGHYVSLSKYIGGNKRKIQECLSRACQEDKLNLIIDNKVGFFAGSMFWCNIDALRPFMKLHLIPEDFESERSQIDGTLAHAVERLLSSSLLSSELKIMQVSPQNLRKLKEVDITEDYKYSATKK